MMNAYTKNRTLFGVAVFMGTVGCSGPTPFEVVESIPGELSQELTVSNVDLRWGDTVAFNSTVRNVGTSTVSVTVRAFCLDILGDAQWDDPRLSRAFDCGALRREIGPGQSALSGDTRVIRSPPGDYAVLVRHLLEPDVKVAVHITVRD